MSAAADTPVLITTPGSEETRLGPFGVDNREPTVAKAQVS
jgi:hypothetical protein